MSRTFDNNFVLHASQDDCFSPAAVDSRFGVFIGPRNLLCPLVAGGARVLRPQRHFHEGQRLGHFRGLPREAPGNGVVSRMHLTMIFYAIYYYKK